MSLINRIREDQLIARKAKNDISRSLLTTLIGESTTAAKNKGLEQPTDDDVIAIIRKFLKGNTEVQVHLSDEIDLAIARTEAFLLNAYLPQQMSELALRAYIESLVSSGTNTVGGIMAELKKNYSGLYDGKLASTIIKELLI